MEDPPVAEPERDVVDRLPVGDQIAGPELGALLARFLLLAGVARHQSAETPKRHVDEPRTVDPAFGHAAPEIRRAEVGARDLDRSSGRMNRQLTLAHLDLLGPHPARILVR